MSDDEISLSKAERDFGVSGYILKKAISNGIIHVQLDNNNDVKYLLSRGEIQKNLELIKRVKKPSNGRSEMKELIESGVRGVNELKRHGIPVSIIYPFYPRRAAEAHAFYCVRLNTWTPACKIDNCRLMEKCQKNVPMNARMMRNE